MIFAAGEITVNFNAAHFKGWTEEEFIAHEKHTGLTPSQLKEAYALIPQAAKEEKKEAAAELKEVAPKSETKGKRVSK